MGAVPASTVTIRSRSGARRKERRPANWCRSQRPIRVFPTPRCAKWTRSSARRRLRPSAPCAASSRHRCSNSALKASHSASGTGAASPCVFPACCAGGGTSRLQTPILSRRCGRCCQDRADKRPSLSRALAAQVAQGRSATSMLANPAPLNPGKISSPNPPRAAVQGPTCSGQKKTPAPGTKSWANGLATV